MSRRQPGRAFVTFTDGRLERHEQLLERLLKLHGLDQPDLFRTREECIDLAYARQEARIAYVDREDRDVTDEEP